MSNPSFHVACDAKMTQKSQLTHITPHVKQSSFNGAFSLPNYEVCWDPNTVSLPSLHTNFGVLQSTHTYEPKIPYIM